MVKRGWPAPQMIATDPFIVPSAVGASVMAQCAAAAASPPSSERAEVSLPPVVPVSSMLTHLKQHVDVSPAGHNVECSLDHGPRLIAIPLLLRPRFYLGTTFPETSQFGLWPGRLHVSELQSMGGPYDQVRMVTPSFCNDPRRRLSALPPATVGPTMPPLSSSAPAFLRPQYEFAVPLSTAGDCIARVLDAFKGVLFFVTHSFQRRLPTRRRSRYDIPTHLRPGKSIVVAQSNLQ